MFTSISCLVSKKRKKRAIRIAEVVGKTLQCISREVVLVPQDMVMSRTACALRRDTDHFNSFVTQLQAKNRAEYVFKP
jgi:hypothetical protein